MAIDIFTEEVFPLTKASGFAPKVGRKGKLHTATFYRWATTGCRGVVLETLQAGGTRVTSREAIARFFEALSNPEPAEAPVEIDGGPRGRRSPTQRRRAAEKAGRELEALGA